MALISLLRALTPAAPTKLPLEILSASWPTMVAMKRAIEPSDSDGTARRRAKVSNEKPTDIDNIDPVAVTRDLSALRLPARLNTSVKCGKDETNTKAETIRPADSTFNGSPHNIISSPDQTLTEPNVRRLGDYHVSKDERIRLWREDIRPSEQPRDERDIRRVAEIEARARAITALRLAAPGSLEEMPDVPSRDEAARSHMSNESSVTDVSLIVVEPAVRLPEVSASSVMTDEPLIVVEPAARPNAQGQSRESNPSEMSVHEMITQPEGNRTSGTRPRRRVSMNPVQNDHAESRTEDAAIDLLEANLTDGDIELTPEIHRFLEAHNRDIPIVEPCAWDSHSLIKQEVHGRQGRSQPLRRRSVLPSICATARYSSYGARNWYSLPHASAG
jgi:hypothetical protein